MAKLFPLRFSGHSTKAQLDAIKRSQAVIEFELDGTIIWANENFLGAMGYTLEEIRGQHHRMFVEPAYASSDEYRSFWESLRNGEYQSAEYMRFAKGGREIWIQASYNPIFNKAGKPVKVVKFATDITARKLQSAEFEGQINAIGKAQAVIQFDLDGTILWANDNFLGAVGYTLDEIRGQHHRMFVDPAYADSSDYSDFWSKLRRGEFQAAEYKRFAKGGREIWIQATYNPIFDASGRPFKVVKFATDITAQVKRRMESERLGKMLDQSLDQIVAAVDLSKQQSTSVASSSNQTSSTVNTVASATEELNSSIQEIAKASAMAKNAVDQVISQTDAADKSTHELARAAESMNSIVALIQDIAGQINLLALNATIEAARAGDAGKGFAVVASEVKSLASQVEHATNKISDEIAGMQRVSGDVVQSLSLIKSSVQSVSESVNGVAGAVEEQQAVTAEISNSMQAASSGVREIDSSIGEILAAVEAADKCARDGMGISRNLQANA